jgi:signal peptidase II
MPRRYKLFLLVGLLSLAADQLSKVWARTLPTDARGYGIPVTVIENFFDWRLSHNTGSAFGMFGGIGGARVILSLVGVAAVIAIVFLLRKARDDQRRLTWALGLVAGGAVGNVIDRIAFGKVTDFVVWKYHSHEWPTFNVADAALVIGVGLLFFDVGKEPKPQAVAAEKNDAGGGKRARKR